MIPFLKSWLGISFNKAIFPKIFYWLFPQMDLAGLCLKAGVKNLSTVFLMTDAQVADEKFLVLINDLLASGKKLFALECEFPLESESSQGAPRSGERGHRNERENW